MKFQFSIFNFVSRWWQNKGFGIESRIDYDFLHDVIHEKLPYYAYATMRKEHPKDSERQHRQRELIYRVHNALRDKDHRIIQGVLKDNAQWQQLLRHPHVITYDMQTLGIAIIDPKRYPAHYKILPV